MVPSWTETLIEAGVEVIGRTRYCIHPADRVSSIPVVGGTKDWDLELITQLAPDIVILDQEENPLSMAQTCPAPYLATHVASLQDMPLALEHLSKGLSNSRIQDFAREWTEVIKSRPAPQQPARVDDVIYVIWKNPWMAVSRETFVGSMLAFCGYKLRYLGPEKYPMFDLESLPGKERTLLMFSSEPYPFLQRKEGLEKLGFPTMLVDGEHYSWFGVRSLRFLKELK